MMDKNENFKVVATADFYELLQDLDKSEKHLFLGHITQVFFHAVFVFLSSQGRRSFL